MRRPLRIDKAFLLLFAAGLPVNLTTRPGLKGLKMLEQENRIVAVPTAPSTERKLDAMYPSNQLGEQVRKIEDCFSMGTLLRETFFTHAQ